MSQKRIEDQFNEELERYILGEASIHHEQANSEEDETLLEIGKALWDERKCPPMNEEKLRTTFIQQLEEERKHEKMKRNKSIKKIAVTAGMVAVLGAGMSQTALGQEAINSVIAHFSTKNISILQENQEKAEAARQAMIEKRKNEPMPEEYRGKIFDAEGNEFTYFPAYLEGAYNANGEPLFCVKDGVVYTEEEWNKKCQEEEAEEPLIDIKDISKINDYTSFDVILPSYLPEGIKFDVATVYCEEDVKDSPLAMISYIDKSGNEAIYLDEREACEEAGFETSTYDEIEEVEINGVKGLMYDNSLNWETENTIYSLMSLDESITRDEMIQIARSMKEAQ